MIALRRPSDYEPDQGARFEVHLEKARGMVAAALAFENAALRDRLRIEARAAALLEMAVCGFDLTGFSALAIEDAIEEGERELASEPADHRGAALVRALAALGALLDDDALPLAA